MHKNRPPYWRTTRGRVSYIPCMTAKPSNTEQELVSIRDTVESIWIAIVLAFVLRAFMIEAFVIPTGSMIPTLQEGDKLMTAKYVYHLREPRRGDRKSVV